MQNKKIICFDFDGTLADSKDLEHASMVKTCQYFGHDEITEENIETYYGPTESGIVEMIVGKEESNAAIAYLFNIYSELQDSLLHFDPKMEILLKQLSQNKDIHVVLVTGRSQETLEISLGKLGIESYFEKTYSGAMDRSNKAESMKQVKEDYDCSSSDLLYIGDTTSDIETMREEGYDIISVGYFHNVEYQNKLKEMNKEYYVDSIEKLTLAINEAIQVK